jgi:hypothetical protein
MQRSLKQKLLDHPIIMAWFGVWFVVAALNFHAGVKTGGYPLAIAFVCVAMLGAYASKELDGVDGARRFGLTALIVLQLLLGQWAGWSTLGFNLNSNAAGLDSDAGTHNTAAEDLARAKAARAELGTPRSIGAIEADEHLECESGVGPKCTALRRELSDARRAADLDRQIPDLVKQLGDGPQLTDPNAPYRVAQAFGGFIGSVLAGKPVTASRDDVIFWFSIFVTAVLEFVGTCGPWLFRLSDKWADPEPPQAPFDAWDFGPPRLTHQGIPEREDLARLARPPAPNGNGTTVGVQPVLSHTAPHAGPSGVNSDRHGDFHSDVVRERQSSPGGSGTPAGGDGLHQPLQTPAGVPTNQHQHGAPISIYFGDGGRLPAGQSPSPTPLVPIDQDKTADRNVAALRQVTQRRIEPEIEQSVREAPDVPVDNSELVNLLHGLNGFKAACLVEQKGAWIDAEQIYQRYAAWAQERACSEQAFHSLFPAVSGVKLHLAGGVPHYAGVALKRLAIAKEAS